MSSPAYQQMAAELRSAIEDGTYPPGSPLPKIVDLAQRYRVAKQTAREALAEIESEGLIDVTRRRGTIVRPHPVRRRLTRSRQVSRENAATTSTPPHSHGPPWPPRLLCRVKPLE
ncbi:GntR family transcriptional regulator [Streptomyces sp. NPDC051644]|uniref:GntR family transcriptional regulator n=1 Tax=Streptomyces sp. NPDC051644 TaxID=3365666 RepID=UPI00379CC1D4